MSRSRFLSVAVVLAAGCGGDGLDRLADGGHGRVVEALSGEVLRLEDGRSVRLAGVHAPGEDAEAALEALTAGRKVALLHGGERSDVYGRTVAHVRVMNGRRWAQGALLDAGLAQVRTMPGEAALAAEMLRREARARSLKRGLWAEPTHSVRLPDEIGEDDAGFMIVEGRVERIERIRNSLSLDFGPDQRGFSVAVTRRLLSDFEAAGLFPEILEGRMIRVRGAVGPSRFGPVMRLDHPEQIELLGDEVETGG